MFDNGTEIFSFVLWAVFGYFVCKIIMVIVTTYLQYRADSYTETVAHLYKITHEVKIEQHDDIYYWYDLHSQEFIAQGKTRDEIVDVLKARWSTHLFLIDEEEIIAGPEFIPIYFSRDKSIVVDQ